MITIPIPEWIQWGALVLAMVYAIPKALRAVIVASFYLFCLGVRAWPMRIRGESGEAKLLPRNAVGRSEQVTTDIVGWAFGERPVFNETELETDPDIGKFVPGDVVELLSGGPSMTVSGTERRPDGSTMVGVDWFDGSTSQSAAYPPAQLKKQYSSEDS